jgi:hypothetical protein
MVENLKDKTSYIDDCTIESDARGGAGHQMAGARARVVVAGRCARSPVECIIERTPSVW